MKFWSGYVWTDSGELHPCESLLLQQVKCGKQAVILAAIGKEDEGAPFIKDLKNWFQQSIIQLCERMEEDSVERVLEEQFGKKLPRQTGFAGIIVIDEKFWLLQGEDSEAFLFNKRFNRTNVKKFCRPGITGGYVEKGIGILLGSKKFYQGVSLGVMKQCLAAQDIVREGQIENRLRELAEEGYRKCGENGCALYIRTT